LLFPACSGNRRGELEQMPQIEYAGPIPELLRQMKTGQSRIFAWDSRFDDHVRIWFRTPEGNRRVVDFGASLDGVNRFMEHECPTAGEMPAFEPVGKEPRGVVKRLTNFVRDSYVNFGKIERAVWLGRYRIVHLTEYHAIEDGDSDVRTMRVSAILFAADESRTRSLGEICNLPPRDLHIDGHHRVVGEPIDAAAGRLFSWAEAEGRQTIVNAALKTITTKLSSEK
jgi:hypothetical protein